MRSISLRAIQRKVARHCSHCSRPCKEDYEVIRLLHNEYMSKGSAQIDLYCARAGFQDFQDWYERKKRCK